jgi:hypothetical protein
LSNIKVFVRVVKEKIGLDARREKEDGKQNIKNKK